MRAALLVPLRGAGSKPAAGQDVASSPVASGSDPGRSADVHLAIDERTRQRTAVSLDMNVGGMYRMAESRCAVK